MQNSLGRFVKGTHWRSKKPWWDRDWLYDQYIECAKSTEEIAHEGGVGGTAILYWLKKHKIPRRTTAETRKVKHWGSVGSDNPMWNMKGELNPNWAGGVSPERQEFYASIEWKNACSAVWKRDKATCQRCKMKRKSDIPFHIHHITSFSNREIRADTSNLVLLCEVCHHFVHSRKNKEREYLQKI